MEMLGQVHSLTALLLQAAETMRDKELGSGNGRFETHRPSPHKRWKSEQGDADHYGSCSGSDCEDVPSLLPRRKLKPYQRMNGVKRQSVSRAASSPPSVAAAVFTLPLSPEEDDEMEEGGRLRGSAQQHNEVEKRRRAFLSSCYSELKELLPACKETKASNVLILGSAAEHVAELDQTERELRVQIDDALLHREELNARAASLNRQSTQRRLVQVLSQVTTDTGAALQMEEVHADVTPTRAWSPPHVGDSSDEASMDDEAAHEVPDLSTSRDELEEYQLATPSLGEAAELLKHSAFVKLSAPAAPLKPSFAYQTGSTQLGGQLLMLLAAASAHREKKPECNGGWERGVESPTDSDALASSLDGSAGSRRNARKPARFL